MAPLSRPEWRTYYDIYYSERLDAEGFDQLVHQDLLEVQFIQEFDEVYDQLKELEALIVSCGAPYRPRSSDSAVVYYYWQTGTFYVQYFTENELTSYCYVPPDEAGLILSCYHATHVNNT